MIINPSLKICPVGIEQIRVIRALAYKIWPTVFHEILSSEQIEYMMEMMYSEDSLANQILVLNHHFLLVRQEKVLIGFVSYQINFKSERQTKIHKLYLDTSFRGKGFGNSILQELEVLSRAKGDLALVLNVNRNNSALHFYLRAGFSLVLEEKIDIGNGFFMDDLVLRKLF